MATKTYGKNSELATLSKTSSRIAAAVSFLCEDAGIPYARISAAHVARTWMTRE
jgi:hypothetical protein